MRTIYKYQLDGIRTTIDVPFGAKALTVQVLHNGPTLWMLVDTSNTLVSRTFVMCGTGYDVPENIGEYIGTFQEKGGLCVAHVFEETKHAVD